MYNEYTCFDCYHFWHLNPDEDFCSFHNKAVTVFTPVCSDFEHYTLADYE